MVNQFLDQFGQPIQKKALVEPFAQPSLGSVRSVISGHPADGLTPYRLASILRQAAEGEPQAYLELAEDMEERDLHYSAVLSTRKRQVAQLPITVSAASDEKDQVKHADFIRDWLQKDILTSALVDILDAIGKGYSITEVMWHSDGATWLPQKLIARPQRWFKPLREDGETLVLREDGQDKLLPPAQFIIHRHPSKSGLTIRSGLARIAAWAFLYKSYTLKDWAIFVQNYGMPIRIGKYGQGAKPDELKTLWKAVKNVAGDMAAIIPDNMLVELIDIGAKSTTVDLYERRADWMDRQVSKLVLGQTTTTDAISGGHAVAQEHRLVQEDIERSDAAILSATLNQQLIANIIAFNFGPQKLYPKINIGRPDEVPLEKVVDAIQKTRLPVEASWLRDRLGAPDPAPDAETVGGQATVTQNGFHQIAGFSRQEEDKIEQMAARLEDESQEALKGLTNAIREEVMQATSFHDLINRLDRLKLNPAELSNVMAQCLTLAHFAGQASVIDELDAK